MPQDMRWLATDGRKQYMCIESHETGAACAKCSRRLDEHGTVHLWDGKDYCRECVSAVSPMLLELADRFSALCERIAINPREAVTDNLVASFFAGTVLTGFLCVVGVQNRLEIWAGLLLGLFCAVVATLLTSYGAYRNARAVRGEVKAENGRLIRSHPVFGDATWALADCRWRVGKARDAADSFSRRVHLRRKILIVECPRDPPIVWWRVERVPCGLTDETYEAWRVFFEFVGMECGQRRRWWWPTVAVRFEEGRIAK
jgi:hypothetical protein